MCGRYWYREWCGWGGAASFLSRGAYVFIQLSSFERQGIKAYINLAGKHESPEGVGIGGPRWRGGALGWARNFLIKICRDVLIKRTATKTYIVKSCEIFGASVSD